MSSSPPVLRIDGLVDQALDLTPADLEALPADHQVPDVSRLVPGRKGDGVRLRPVLERAGIAPSANYLTLHADRDDFHVSVPLESVIDQAILIYRHEGKPLEVSAGGPIRMIIQDPTACRAGELDDCANVKYLSRLELEERKGRDTRPHDDAEHEALHARQAAEAARGGDSHA
ncbi:MAG: molybdopterin-dependent oxidoreductase [Isosphaeraceae bacterium]|nr:molybdopterin-dependent oxidoreductase [Isosphaeraceae bacterium]